MAEQFSHPGVTQGASEGARGKHVKERVCGAADEGHGACNECHGGAGLLQTLGSAGVPLADGDGDEREHIPHVVRRPAEAEDDDHAGDQERGLLLGLDGHLGDPAAHAAIADHEDGEGDDETHQGLQQQADHLLALGGVFPDQALLSSLHLA